MPKLTLIGLYFWICLAQKVVSGEDLYHKVEGELVLKPDKSTVPDSITSILWKHGKNKVAEWDKDFGGILEIYAGFKGRTTLDQTTGELRISGLNKTDSGVYSVEFNSKLLEKTYTLSVIKAVPKPIITSSCNANLTSCTLTCEGNTTDAEPVTYSWKVGEGAWEVGGKLFNVFKSDTGKSTNGYKYICKLKNAVSGEVSEPVGEVFGPEAVPKPTITSSCNPDKTSCTLTCEGNTTDAEPVTYSWKVGEGAWEVLYKQRNVSKSNTGKSTNGYKYICKLNNAVSGEVSEPVGEVFGSEYLYHEVGGELVLTPDKSTVPDSITSILWKHGECWVAYWDKDSSGLDIYGAFKERTTLDQTTGELRISGLKKTDSGVYSVEFNSKLLEKTYTLSVIKAVPKPTITSSCNPDKTSCILTCEGNTTDAEPVTYSWKVGEGAWEVVDKQLIVFKSNTGKSTNSYKYTCKLHNSVSGEVSEPVGEVFGPEPSIRDFVGVVVTAIVAFVFIVISGMLVWKKKTGYPQDTWIDFLRRFCGGICGRDGEPKRDGGGGTGTGGGPAAAERAAIAAAIGAEAAIAGAAMAAMAAAMAAIAEPQIAEAAIAEATIAAKAAIAKVAEATIAEAAIPIAAADRGPAAILKGAVAEARGPT
ncbi:uncharacterized protein LOC129840333 [Salvelinus fontinalis]|uniref:uncharacterized protein LOC129840333 n=1 Tax=Salvelinus fontinalis TaxID=8038 RepID=UPI002486AB53|nr:uncharacterized protein LOC129840333 [Salvelinus fontinalis]